MRVSQESFVVAHRIFWMELLSRSAASVAALSR
jgi:hypothetical protein